MHNFVKWFCESNIITIIINAISILLRYRLAPQYPYPAAMDDCYTATKYFLENAAKYETDPTRIAVAGKIKIYTFTFSTRKMFLLKAYRFHGGSRKLTLCVIVNPWRDGPGPPWPKILEPPTWTFRPIISFFLNIFSLTWLSIYFVIKSNIILVYAQKFMPDTVISTELVVPPFI